MSPWREILLHVYEKVPVDVFNQWFKPTGLVVIDDWEMKIFVPDQSFIPVLKSYKEVLDAAKKEAGYTQDLCFEAPLKPMSS